MTPTEILDAARSAITVDRSATHGQPEDSFAAIAEVWSWWLQHRVSPHDVAMMMGLMKDARARGNPLHMDNYVDGVGYRALAAQMVANGPEF